MDSRIQFRSVIYISCECQLQLYGHVTWLQEVDLAQWAVSVRDNHE